MIPVLYIIGNSIKGLDSIKNKYIPLILLFISIILTPLVIGGNNANNIVQRILVAGATVFTNQIYKQSRREE